MSGSKIRSCTDIKVLGFHFSSRPNMNTQVASIKKKMISRQWMIYHLKHRGFNDDELVMVYKTMILSIHDYCSTVSPSSSPRNSSVRGYRLGP